LPHADFHSRFAPLGDRLFGYAFALTRDREQAADLFQDCVVRAMSARSVPEQDRAFRAWLFAILRNLWTDRIRARRRRGEAHARIAEANEVLVPLPPEAVVINQLAVREAFACLSLDHRDVLALIDIAGFSYDEAAELLAVPRGTVMSRVSRARQALFDLLSDDHMPELPANVTALKRRVRDA
jgi:RNA polymerase sigma-70 factor, ECF subfamily